MMEEQKLIERSRDVFLDCSLKNGGIVAGNAGNPSYTVDMPNYHYVWPRDAAFISVAMICIDMREQAEGFYQWCDERALKSSNVLLQRYSANGLPEGFLITELYDDAKIKDLLKFSYPASLFPLSKEFRVQLQPDGNGLVLWSLGEYEKKYSKMPFPGLAEKLADGLVELWDSNGYKYFYHDAWEEKVGAPGITLTYTLATSVVGLQTAIELLGEKKSWVYTLESMQKKLDSILNEKLTAVFGEEYSKESYVKLFSDIFTTGKFDPEKDASLLFLFWPKKIASKEDLLSLLDELDVEGGIVRYKNDSYDGDFVDGSSFRKGGKSWPLLNFWASLALNNYGLKEKAQNYYDWVIQRTTEKIPEQLDANGLRGGPAPLCWAHAMFILAHYELKG